MHVIVVDDHASNRELCRLLLSDVVDEVTALSDGQELVDTLPRLANLPDAILLDVMMPVKNGFSAAKEVRKLFPQNHIPIIFLTALDDDTSFEQCLSLGDDFILKPVDGSVIRAKVQAHCRVARMHSEVKEQRDELKRYRRHIEYEHSVAESIFDNLKKEMTTHLNGLSGIDYFSTSKTLFNGDLIIAAQRPFGGAYIMVADATGHGLPAAISTLPAARAFFSMAQKGLPISEIVTELNSVMARFLPVGMMLAANVYEVKSNGVEVACWAGGLPDTYLLNPDGSIAHTISSKHMPLGVLADSEFEVNIDFLKVVPQQKLFCYTDGVIEAKNDAGQLYGEDRLKSLLLNHPVTIPSVYESVRNYSKKLVNDDLSILIVDFPVTNRKTCLQQPTTLVSRLPCEFFIRLNTYALQELTVLSELRLALKGVIFGEHLDLVCTILSELLSNAVDHGLLELFSDVKDEVDGFSLYYQQQRDKLDKLDEDKWVTLMIGVNPLAQEVSIEIEHNGKGFDSNAMLKEFNEHDEYGRGLSIVNSLCDFVQYLKEGRCVRVLYRYNDFQ
ncbi:SpoIIE family protein phosphatase [Vibrio sp. HN007]|uniref:ATP-binding SpoIIE family protein phosphatase n=1 Tax=Vibrio iocasae TaxID=3098914 RepID=UPI0035D42B4D